jgi:hypothetical protein
MPTAIGNKPTNWELIANWMTGTEEAENCITTRLDTRWRRRSD